MNNVKITEGLIKQLFDQQSLGVLSTNDANKPYSNLVAFASTNDLKEIIFSTSRITRKYSNISKNSFVSLLIDNRSNTYHDFYETIAVTCLGKAKILDKQAEVDQYYMLYVNKHPYLKDFISSPNSCFLQISVQKYIIVQRFQNVMEYHPV